MRLLSVWEALDGVSRVPGRGPEAKIERHQKMNCLHKGGQ